MSILISVNGLAFKDKPIFNNAAVIEKIKIKENKSIAIYRKICFKLSTKLIQYRGRWPNFCNSLPHPRNPQIFLETCPFIQTGIN